MKNMYNYLNLSELYIKKNCARDIGTKSYKKEKEKLILFEQRISHYSVRGG